MLGVYNLAMARLYSYIYQEENKKFCIVHSLDGYDEVSLTSRFKVVTNNGEQLLYTEALGFPKLGQEELYGGDTPEEAARIFRNVIEATATPAQINAVLVNAAFGIQTVDQEKSIEECIEIAKDSLYGEKALKTLETFIALNS